VPKGDIAATKKKQRECARQRVVRLSFSIADELRQKSIGFRHRFVSAPSEMLIGPNERQVAGI
jgi:hypothetical protein